MEKETDNKTNEIVYDEGFRSVSKRLEKAKEDEPIPVDEQKFEPKSDRVKPLLVTIQLILCLAAALSLFLLRSTGSTLYDAFRDWYDEEMQKPLISRGVFDHTGLDRLFSPATTDEISPESD